MWHALITGEEISLCVSYTADLKKINKTGVSIYKSLIINRFCSFCYFEITSFTDGGNLLASTSDNISIELSP